MKLETLLKRLGSFEDIETLAPNQYKIYLSKGVLFQSYNTIMAIKYCNEMYTRRDWNISRTTTRYLCRFLNVNSVKDIRELVDKEEIKFWE